MANQVDPRYFDFGNAFIQGGIQRQEQDRRNAMLDLEQRQQGLVERRFAADEQARAAQGEQQARNRAIYAKLFAEAGLDPAIADTEGADELAAHLLAQKTAPPAKPKLIEDRTGRLVPEAEGVQPWHAPQEPKGPGTLYQFVGADGKPRFGTAEQALGQTPYDKPAASDSTLQQGERTAAFLATRLESSLGILDKLGAKNPDAASPGFLEKGAQAVGADYLANKARSPDRQQANVAQLDALDAALTLGTGAAYTKEQLANYATVYFPQLGDDPATRKAKKAKFDTLVAAARAAAGRGAVNIDKVIQPTRPGQAASGPFADPAKEARYQAWKKAHGGG